MDITRLIVLEPRDLWWERHGVFNPAAIEIGGKIHLLYRAVGGDHISRFGLAISEDGEVFTRFDQPIFEGDPHRLDERLGVEDPRAVVISRDIYITYTAASVYPAGHVATALSPTPTDIPWRTRVSAVRTRDFRHFDRLGALLPEIDSKDAVLFGQKHLGFYWLLHRITPGIYIARSRDLKRWEGNLEMMAPKEAWEELKIGAACPPIAVDGGWLLLYHGVSRQHVYSVGAALLAKENPAVVLKRSKKPFLAPHLDWEKRGEVPNVVFPTGSVTKQGRLYIYYGAADRVVGLAKISLESILATLDESTS